MDDVAVGHDGLDTADIVPGHAVAHSPHTAGVGDDGAADGGGLFAGVGGIEQAHLRRRGSHLGDQCAGLGGDGHVLGVHRKDLVHLHQGQHDAAVFAVGAAGKARARAPGHHRDVVFIGVLHDGGDFFLRQDLHVQLRREHAVLRHLVVVKLLGDGLSYPDAGGVGD